MDAGTNDLVPRLVVCMISTLRSSMHVARPDRWRSHFSWSLILSGLPGFFFTFSLSRHIKTVLLLIWPSWKHCFPLSQGCQTVRLLFLFAGLAFAAKKDWWCCSSSVWLSKDMFEDLERAFKSLSESWLLYGSLECQRNQRRSILILQASPSTILTLYLEINLDSVLAATTTLRF